MVISEEKDAYAAYEEQINANDDSAEAEDDGNTTDDDDREEAEDDGNTTDDEDAESDVESATETPTAIPADQETPEEDGNATSGDSPTEDNDRTDGSNYTSEVPTFITKLTSSSVPDVEETTPEIPDFSHEDDDINDALTYDDEEDDGAVENEPRSEVSPVLERQTRELKPKSCSDLLLLNVELPSGVYDLYTADGRSYKTYCKMVCHIFQFMFHMTKFKL